MHHGFANFGLANLDLAIRFPSSYRCQLAASLFLALMLLALPGFADTNLSENAPDDHLAYGLVTIDGIGHAALSKVQNDPRLGWWVELDDQLLVLARQSVLGSLAGRPVVQVLAVEVRLDDLYVIRRGHQSQLLAGAFDVLAKGGRFAVVQSHGGQPVLDSLHDDSTLLAHGHELTDRDSVAHQREQSLHAAVLPFVPNVVLARQQVNGPDSLGVAKQAAMVERYGAETVALAQELVDQVDANRWFAAIEVLAGFNRYTHSAELLQARDWLVQQFDALPGLAVTTSAFEVGSTTAYNVISTLQGSARPDEWHLIGAHYDSISQSTGSSAPGAEDNASGCAGVLEMARIFAANPPEETVIFLCYSGEELGLIGSEDHATQVVADGDADKIKTMLNMDMIGYTGDSDLDCLLETDTAFASLLTPFSDAAATYTNLRVVTSLFAFGSDHVPYLNRNIPALLTIENDWDSYPDYHRTGDVPANIDLDMGGQTLRMNVGAMALRIGATVGSVDVLFGDGFEAGDVSAWSKSSP